jgi:hypothetical protein
MKLMNLSAGLLSPIGGEDKGEGAAVRRTRTWTASLRGVVLLLGLGAAFRAGALGVLVPAYFYPAQGSAWDSLNRAAQRVPLIAIMNPNNGPTTAPIADYSRAVTALRNAGGLVIGYVYSSYTARPVAQVKADIDRYLSFYTIDGIFVDEMTNDPDAAHLAYYAELYSYIKSNRPSYLVVGNPGTKTLADYLLRPTADLLVTFENNTGYAQYVPDPWTQTRPATAFSHLCYATAAAETMTNYVDLAARRNAGYIYVTDDSGSNPWDRLPSYWETEVACVEKLNRAAASNQRPVLGISRQASGAVQVNVTGAPGRYVLQASANLTNWQPMTTNVSATGNFSIHETVVTDRPVWTYRAEQ